MKIETLPHGDSKAASALVRLMKEHGAEDHPLLNELRMYAFWSATTWVLYNARGVPLSLNSTKIGKRANGKFEPCANWYGAYTLPEHRRKGYATRLYEATLKPMKEAGNVCTKSLCSSSGGLGLDVSLGHLCWGRVPTGEVFAHTPLPWAAHEFTELDVPPGAPRNYVMTQSEIDALIKEGLRYDKTS